VKRKKVSAPSRKVNTKRNQTQNNDPSCAGRSVENLCKESSTKKVDDQKREKGVSIKSVGGSKRSDDLP